MHSRKCTCILKAGNLFFCYDIVPSVIMYVVLIVMQNPTSLFYRNVYDLLHYDGLKKSFYLYLNEIVSTS